MELPGYVTNAKLKVLIASALEEDLHTGDHTSLATLDAAQISKAKCLAKDTGVIAGVFCAELAYQLFDPTIKFTKLKQDGDPIKPGDVIFEVEGKTISLLSVERIALNIMQRMSGIATVTNRIAKLIEPTGCRVLDTRKTTPLVRMLEKWAVAIGGGVNHRYGLFDAILIKDNHIDAAGSVSTALERTFTYLSVNKLSLPIIVEARTLDDVTQVLSYPNVTRVLLDNMTPPTLKNAVSLVNGRLQTEASGNITPENALSYAQTGVNFISMGAITHSFKSLDLSIKIQ